MTKTNFLKTLALTAVLFLGTAIQAQIKVGDNPTSINPNSVLEIESTNKGVLLPRLGLSATNLAAPLSAHVAGMAVYNTATAADVTPGFYYNDGTKWVRLYSASTALNTSAANNLVTITNGTGATLTAMTVGVDTTQLKSFLAGKVTSVVSAPLSGNGTTASPISITTGDLSAGTLLTTTGTPTAALLKTAGYNVDTTALKTFISNAINNGAITGKNTTAGNSLVTITNGTGATLTAMVVGVDTTALKSFLAGKVSVVASAPFTGNGTAASPLGITTNNTTAGQLVTVTNGTGATFTAMTVAIDTTALKSFISNAINNGAITGKNTTAANNLVTVTNGTGATLTAMTVGVDTTNLKSFLNNKITVTASAPLSGNGTTASPLAITTATATNGTLTTVTNGTNATFTALKYDVDTTALKTFLAGKVSVVASTPLTGMGTTASPLAITQNTLSAGQLTTVTGGANATFTAATVGIDTTALKAFVSGKTAVAVTAPITGNGTTASPLAITTATATNGTLTTVTNGTNAAFTALKYDVDTTALKTFLAGKVTSVVSAPLSGNGTTASPISITTGDLSVGTLLTTTGTPIAALLKTAGYNVDTTALKTFLAGKVSVTASAPLTGMGTTASPLAITRATATSGVLTTVSNGTDAAFTALKYDVDTTALKTFIANSMGKTTSAGSLITVTNGSSAALKDNTIAVDTTALKSFSNIPANGVSIGGPPPATTGKASFFYDPALLQIYYRDMNGNVQTWWSYGAINGLSRSGNNFELGGTLTKPTTITTSAANTLSLAGLQTGASTDSIVVASGATGTLKKIAMISGKKLGVVTTAATAFTIPDTADVVIYNGTAAATFTLPAASASYGRELRILNFAKSTVNAVITLSTAVISEGSTPSDISDTRINSKGSTYEFPAGLGSQEFNTITLISNGTSWYKLGN